MPAKKSEEIGISVVVPTLNEEKNIGPCLQALREQDFEGGYEVIVADGNSEDKTREIAERLADKVIIEKRRSIAFERNAGAQHAKGKIIVFTDADSCAPKNWLSSVYRIFEDDKELSLVYGPVFFSDTSKEEQWISSFFMPKFMKIMDLLSMHNPIGSNMAIRREVYEKIGGFNTEYITCEDLDLGKRAIKHGKLKYVKHMHTLVSARRVKKWGYARYVGFHLFNGVRYHLTGNASRKYEDVR
ncbi:MAG: glycosyltransferase [Candidatus Iainarchaeum archaeon]|uniref:Glycosyltransferase n=1 Tax=Candidatus Iainarchaeum sp. TaxID=3101447 RepID=A0A7T9DKC7_9ARCH|nr:MAG: glycosyltransferase [Candidatus Diapherotrites archaeon]